MTPPDSTLALLREHVADITLIVKISLSNAGTSDVARLTNPIGKKGARPETALRAPDSSLRPYRSGRTTATSPLLRLPVRFPDAISFSAFEGGSCFPILLWPFQTSLKK